MELSHVLDPRRWRQRFRSESDVRTETIAAGQAPDATVDEVGSAPAPEGFEGTALHGHTGSGYGTGDPGGPGWAGWGASATCAGARPGGATSSSRGVWGSRPTPARALAWRRR